METTDKRTSCYLNFIFLVILFSLISCESNDSSDASSEPSDDSVSRASLADLKDDKAIYPKSNMSRPALLDPYIDPTFGTVITRITEHSDSDRATMHKYSKQNPWNADDSYLLLLDEAKNWYLYDGDDYSFIKPLTSIHKGASKEDPVWDPTDPDILYYFYNNEYRRVNVTTDTYTTLRTFGGYNYVTTMGEGTTISINGRVAMAGLSDTGAYNVEDVFVYDIYNNIVGDPQDISYAQTNGGIDWVSITHSGDYVGVLGLSSSDRYGFEVYEVAPNTLALSLKFNRNDNVFNRNKHGDFAIDLDGEDIFVAEYYTTDPIFIKIGLSDSIEEIRANPRTTILEADWGYYHHVSGRCRDMPGWAIVSTHASYGEIDNGISQPFEDEIFAIKTDGSEEVRRIAHTYNQYYSPDCNVDVWGEDYWKKCSYWAEPQVSANNSCTKFIFRSNWGDTSNNGGNVDTYVVELP